MKLTLVANFIKLFWNNLCCYPHIALSFNSGYAARSINYAEKSVMVLAPGACTIKLFTAVIYSFRNALECNVLGKPFQPSLTFVKAGAYSSEAPFRCSTLG